MPSIAARLLPAFALALALSGGAQAATDAGYYTATLEQPAQEARAIAGGVVWRCEGVNCSAPKGRDRPLRVCTELANKVGAIASFNAADKSLDDATLARCNK